MYLLSVFLSIGTRVVTFALSAKVDEIILLFKLQATVVTASFFEFENFNNFSTSSEVTTKILREKPLSEQDLELTSDLILRILG